MSKDLASRGKNLQSYCAWTKLTEPYVIWVSVTKNIGFLSGGQWFKPCGGLGFRVIVFMLWFPIMLFFQAIYHEGEAGRIYAEEKISSGRAPMVRFER